jgi:hypothetical protein
VLIAVLGLYSAISYSLAIAAPSNIFNSSFLSSLVEQARLTQNSTAVSFSNGNADLAKGIDMQLSLALDLYQQDKASPLEMNLGTITFSLHHSPQLDFKFICQHLDTMDLLLSRIGLTDYIPASIVYSTRHSPEVELTSPRMILPHPQQ